MNVLADRHHAGLYHSLQRLFEDRLGAMLWTPVGHEWWDAGYWRFGEASWGDDRLAQQFLDPGAGWVDAQGRWIGWTDLGGWGLITADPEFPERPITGIRLEFVPYRRWDVVVATAQDNQVGFARFAADHGARFVVLVGNTGQEIDWSLDPLVLNSSEMPILGHGVEIGQEFDSDGLFRWQPIRWRRTITSFVNCMPSIACWPLLEQAREALPEFHVAVHGIDGPDGNVKPISAMATLMAASGWGWHDKVHGDGFGHVIHYWAALGRPLIGHASHYQGKRAGVLWRDLETCIDLDQHPLDEAVGLIREISADPVRHDAMGRAIRAVFDETTDWAEDARKVRALLGIA